MMDQWFNWVWRAPLSGNVDQNIAPQFLSPNISFNFAGDAELESSIVQSTASYGKQLSVITDVLLELTDDLNSEAVNKLRSLHEKIETVKSQSRENSRSQLDTIFENMDVQTREETVRELADRYIVS